MSNSQLIDVLDATPRKRIYQPIIADYGLKTGICELVDNSLDARTNAGSITPLEISIDIDTDQRTIIITDNASGVPVSELEKLVSPGETTSDGVLGAIGFFGVGSKRAVVALAEQTKMFTRFGEEKTYRLLVDDEWLASDDWHLPYYEVDDIEPSTTRIELSSLRVEVDEKRVEELREHLAAIYGRFISDGDVEIMVNLRPVEAKLFDQWSFPDDTEYHPRRYVRDIVDYKSRRSIRFDFTPGLTFDTERVASDYGVFVYCNKRLITRALKEPEVGFSVPHSDQSLARIIVNLSGPSDLMPWLSNKSGINYNHQTFKTIRSDIQRVVDQWTKISARFKPEFTEKIEPHKDGVVSEERLNLGEPVRLKKIPPIANRKKNYKDQTLELNRTLGGIKPWTRGLYETMIAEELIARQPTLSQKNRISMILLDSTIEIGCKEFLLNKAKMPWNTIKKLTRNEIHDAVEKHVLTGDAIWQRLARYYKTRNTFIHETADLSIPDRTVEDFRTDTKTYLAAAFKIRFP